MAEKTVEELVETYSRAELDKMAKELGLVPEEFPNKAAVAKAILAARKGKPPVVKIPEKIGKKGVYAKIAAMEKYTRKIGADIKAQERENLEAVEKMGADIREKAGVIESAVKKIQGKIGDQVKANENKVKEIGAAIKAQEKENLAAVKKIETGISEVAKANKAKVKQIGTDIEKQMKENLAAIKKINTSVKEQAKENEEAVRKIGAAIKELQGTSKEYVKDFYYG